MRRTAAGVAGAALVAALAGLAAHAQGPGEVPVHGLATSDVADVPAGPAAIRGRILHASRPGAVAGLPVVLYALPADGVPGLRGIQTDDRGEFAFENIAADPATAYLVGVRFQEIPFGRRITFAPGELERSLELTVSDPTPDGTGIEVGEVRIRVEPSCRDLQVGQALEVRNPGESVLYVAEADRTTLPPLLEVVLPEQASGFEVPFGSFPQGLERDGARVRFWGPLYPGTQRLEFAYGLPSAGGSIAVTHGFPSGAENVLVLSHRGAPAPLGDALRPAEPTEIDGRPYRVQSAGAVAPDEPLELRLEAPSVIERSDAFELLRTQMWLELDDAALAVDERYELEVSGTTPVESAGPPLLCIPLPDAAQELRFAPSALSMGLTRDPSGALALRGPLPPGESTVSLRYLLPVDRGRVAFERRFEVGFPLLTLFVADTGIVADSDRLHRRRPFQANDRSYVHLEGFEIESGESVQLALSPIAAAPAPSRLASGLIVGAMALASLWFLASPLRARRVEGMDGDVVSDAAYEREAVYAALRDLDHDFETGKLSEDDYGTSRRDLRARAVALLRAEREGQATPAPEPAAPPSCGQCGAAAADDARFCAQCGAALSPTRTPLSSRSRGAA